MALTHVGPSPRPTIKASTTLIFMRHGRALDVDGRCIGQTDVALSREGATEIQQLASDWRSCAAGGAVQPPTAIYSSDLQRARDSARILANVWGLPIEQDARLREMHFGEWDGQRWAVIEATDGARLRRWTERWIETAPPGGEGIGQVEQRAADWIDGFSSGPSESARTIVVVSHAGWIRVALGHLLRHPISRMFDIPVDHSRATILSVGPRGARVIGSNVDTIP